MILSHRSKYRDAFRPTRSVTPVDAVFSERELERLVKARVGTKATRTASRLANPTLTARSVYDELTRTWQRYGIQVPGYNTLEARLTQALAVLAALGEAKAEFRNKFEIVLVPPTRLLQFPLSNQIKAMHPARIRADEVFDLPNHVLNHPVSRAWKVLVIFAQQEGLYLGTPADIIRDKRYMICGYDARGLGLREYAALTLQHREPIDQHTWSVLFGSLSSDATTVPSVNYNYDHYRYELIELDSIFGNDRFRPAIEMTQGVHNATL